MDDIERYRELHKIELGTVIPPEILEKLVPFRDELLAYFPPEIIEFCDTMGQWTEFIDNNIPNLSGIDPQQARLYIIHCRYKESKKRPNDEPPTPSPPQSTKKSASNNSRSYGENIEQPQFDESLPNRIVAKKGAPEVPTRTCMIPTIGIESDYISAFPSVSSSATLREVQGEVVMNGTTKRIVLKRCACGFNEGAVTACTCVSVLGRHLIVARVEKSRASKLGDAVADVLVAWRPFQDDNTQALTWIPMDPLIQWSARPLVDYLIARVRFPVT